MTKETRWHTGNALPSTQLCAMKNPSSRNVAYIFLHKAERLAESHFLDPPKSISGLWECYLQDKNSCNSRLYSSSVDDTYLVSTVGELHRPPADVVESEGEQLRKSQIRMVSSWEDDTIWNSSNCRRKTLPECSCNRESIYKHLSRHIYTRVMHTKQCQNIIPIRTYANFVNEHKWIL